jgi:ABC-type Na+ efflux pump permease subunit
MPDTPLRPDELETYKTPVQTASEASDDATPGRDSRPWIAFGLVLLVLFIVMLLAAIAFGIAR